MFTGLLFCIIRLNNNSYREASDGRYHSHPFRYGYTATIHCGDIKAFSTPDTGGAEDSANGQLPDDSSLYSATEE